MAPEILPNPPLKKEGIPPFILQKPHLDISPKKLVE